MERNVMGELNVYRGSGAKPNFSEIARRHGMDRHTVAKYWREGESAADGRSARGSAFDPLEEVIRAKAQLPGMTKMAVYAFLREGRGEGLPGYGAFTAWCRARDVPFGGVGGREPHPRFETPPGRQLQFDWKEGMRLVDSEGEVFEFSVFTATLGYSRKHRFIPVRSRTLDDLLSCLLATFTRLGGVPEECITDNMSCLVTVSGRRRTRQERAWRFAREAGFELRLCAPRSPQTKGKDESANRFLNRSPTAASSPGGAASPRRWPGSRPRQTRSRTAPPACRPTRCSCGRRRACGPSGTSVSSSRWWAT